MSITPLTEPDMAEAGRRPAVLRGLSKSADKGIFVLTIVVILASFAFVPGFASVNNVVSVFNSAASVGIVAVGMTFVVISANYIDLSVVAQVATAGTIVMALSRSGPAIGILGALVVCLIYGIVNGIAVGMFRANAVVVTLGTNGIGLGILTLASGGKIFFGSAHGPVAAFGAAHLGPIPVSAFAFIVIAAICEFALQRSVFGFTVRAIGSNRESARLVGLRTGSVVIGAFVVTAVCCALAGFVLASYSNTASSTMSAGYDFSALAAIIVGGNSLFGGRGSVARTVIGVFFIAVIGNILVLLGFNYEWQQFVTGAIIVAAVALDALTKRRRS